MQHTLLPIQERKTLRHEYRLRAAIVACFLLSFAGVIGIVSLFPAFIAMTEKERAEIDAVAALKKQKADNGMADVETGLKSDQALLAATTPLVSGTHPSAVIESIVTARGPLTISSLALSHSASAVQVAIEGVAPDRSSLLAFQSRLQDLAPGNKVVLPIEELAKNTNISFSIELTEQLP